MPLTRKFVSGVVALFRKQQSERDLDDEVRAYVEASAAEKMRAGMSRDEAIRAARLDFGGVEAVKEEVRSVGWETRVESFWLDLRYAVRSLAKAPGFTTVALLTLALGIGANTAVFNVVSTFLLKPFPVQDPARLVIISTRWPQLDRGPFSYDDFHDVQQRSHSFSLVVATALRFYNVVGTREPVRVFSACASQRYFQLFGVRPVVGRLFDDADQRDNATPVAVLGQTFWAKEFGSDPGIIGKRISLDDKSFAIVGVAPDDAALATTPVNVWVPLEPNAAFKDRQANYLNVNARLAPGATLASAQSELNAIQQQVNQAHPENEHAIVIDWFVESATRSTRPALLMVLAAVCLVFMVATANVANLVLARATSRVREFAIRESLGAGRRRLLQQLFCESAVLALVAGAVGVLLASWAMVLLNAYWPKTMFRPSPFVIDYRVLLFAAAISILAATLFALAPAIHADGGQLYVALKSGTRTSTRTRSRLQAMLVIGEIALSTALLVPCGLLLRSFWNVAHADPGFRTSNLLTFSIALPRTRYPSPVERTNFFRELIERIRVLPNVISIGGATELPMGSGSTTGGLKIEGRPSFKPSERPTIEKAIVTPGYFETMGIRLLRGRVFDAGDGENAPKAVVINEELAARYWPGEDPVGKRIDLSWGKEGEWQQIVGIVGNVRYYSLETPVTPAAYLVSTQYPVEGLVFVVHTSTPPENIASAVRRQVDGLDPTLPVANVVTMNRIVSDTMAMRESSTLLVLIFGSFAALLAAIGLYGLVSYLVAQRTREIGVRLALGACLADVRRMVVGQGLRLVALGVLVAVPLTAAAARLVSTLLFGVSAMDLVTFGAVVALLGVTGLLASYVPARRASRIEPVEALRYE